MPRLVRSKHSGRGKLSSRNRISPPRGFEDQGNFHFSKSLSQQKRERDKIEQLKKKSMKKNPTYHKAKKVWGMGEYQVSQYLKDHKIRYRHGYGIPYGNHQKNGKQSFFCVDFWLPKYNIFLEIDGPSHDGREDYDRWREKKILSIQRFSRCRFVRIYSSTAKLRPLLHEKVGPVLGIQRDIRDTLANERPSGERRDAPAADKASPYSTASKGSCEDPSGALFQGTSSSMTPRAGGEEGLEQSTDENEVGRCGVDSATLDDLRS